MQSEEIRNIYFDAVAYDFVRAERGNKPSDLEFYISHFPDNCKSILELGCGTGRLTVPLALKGYEVTGIDREQSMLSCAREKAMQAGANVEWIHGDVRDFHLNRQFDVILFPANSLSHLLDSHSVESCLACVQRHLTSNGRFIFQVFTPNLKILMSDPDQRVPVAEYEDTNGRGHVVMTESNRYDDASQINHITWYYSFQDTQEEIAVHLPLRMFYPQELDSLLRYNGFEIIEKYGNFDGSLYETNPLLQIPVCRKL